jgi:hypothetical protein
MAAKNFIQINAGQRLGSQARGFIDQLRIVKNGLAALKADMDQMVLDDGTYGIVESQFGLQAGDGQAFYNLVAGVVSDLAGSNETNLLARCG